MLWAERPYCENGVAKVRLRWTEALGAEGFTLPKKAKPALGVIFDRVWGFDFGPNSNTLSVYIGYLRRKTEADGEPRLIHTVRGVGYMLRD